MSRIKTCFFLYFHGLTLDAAAIENAAKYTGGWLKIADESLVTPISLAPPTDWASVKTDYVDVFRAANPDQWIGLYAGAASTYARPWDPAAEWVDDDPGQMLHAPTDGAPLIATVGGLDYRWVNYDRRGVRTDHKARYLAFLEAYGFSGLFMDSWSPAVFAALISQPDNGGGSPGWFGFAGGLREGPYHLQDTWETTIGTWTAELQAAFAAVGARVWVNGLNYTDVVDPFMGEGQINTLNYADGAMLEHFHRAYRDTTRWTQAVDTGLLARDTDGTAYYSALPWLFTITHSDGSGGTTVSIPESDDELQRFFLATYLLIQSDRSYYTYQPYAHIAYFGYDGSTPRVYWNDDWNLDFGRATGREYRTATESVAWREFTRGYAVVNPTSTPQYFDVPGSYRLWHPTHGDFVRILHDDATTRAVLPAYTGHFFFTAPRAA